MRQVALDIHQSFCEVAIREAGNTRSAGRITTDRATLELFAASLCPTDEVVMEATGPAMEIARMIKPHVARVVVAVRCERERGPRSDARSRPGER